MVPVTCFALFVIGIAIVAIAMSQNMDVSVNANVAFVAPARVYRGRRNSACPQAAAVALRIRGTTPE
ncbi:hypothetical protein RLOC_00007802 [Lonchura striata]|uniref:Uncharacterized protein n=1 Tax=Lonchura striata TaxID=40157 RepID=A0A218UXV5_9PASE|nr:hypothetical protein RLOC_00007802 [Lonchura striata domestica]